MVTYMNDLDYCDRFVAYLDILGFTELTKLAHEDTEYRAFLRGIIRDINTMFPKASIQSDLRFIQFSDSIVLSAKQDREGLLLIIRSVNFLVTHMLDRSTLLRGGIAAGNMHHTDEMMFGPAYLNALAFDKAGSGPHVGLSEMVLRSMEGGLWDNSIEHLICQDPWDLTPMLHTFLQFEEYDGTVFHEGGRPIHQWSVGIAATIAQGATNLKSPAPVRAKWRWLRDYWNRTVAVKGILPPAEPSDWETVAKLAKDREHQALADFNRREREKRGEG